ncbi:hypothetical protein PGB90_004212 [Kerria lacca]
MEKGLNDQLNILVNDEKNISGVLLSDKRGLCIKTTGNAREESSGIITAIIDTISELEPDKSSPEIILESESKCCIIYAGKNINAAVFKNTLH